jgi:hypothetical protein
LGNALRARTAPAAPAMLAATLLFAYKYSF